MSITPKLKTYWCSCRFQIKNSTDEIHEGGGIIMGEQKIYLERVENKFGIHLN